MDNDPETIYVNFPSGEALTQVEDLFTQNPIHKTQTSNQVIIRTLSGFYFSKLYIPQYSPLPQAGLARGFLNNDEPSSDIFSKFSEIVERSFTPSAEGHPQALVFIENTLTALSETPLARILQYDQGPWGSTLADEISTLRRNWRAMDTIHHSELATSTAFYVKLTATRLLWLVYGVPSTGDNDLAVYRVIVQLLILWYGHEYVELRHPACRYKLRIEIGLKKKPWSKASVIGAAACFAVALAPGLVLLPVLGAVGFTAGGVAAGSAAAALQSTLGNVVAGSLFAMCQSAAAGGAIGAPLLMGTSALFGGSSLAFMAAGSGSVLRSYNVIVTVSILPNI